MSVERVSPEEALARMRDQGYAYLDVRSVPEFEQGHPSGAYNVPLVHMGPHGTQPNARFLAVVESHFEKDAPIVVGCRISGRSDQAVALLERAGFTQLLVQEAGFVGTPPLRPGWGPRGLPSSRTPEPGRSWEELAGAK